jgi:hypothetical protein
MRKENVVMFEPLEQRRLLSGVTGLIVPPPPPPPGGHGPPPPITIIGGSSSNPLITTSSLQVSGNQVSVTITNNTADPITLKYVLMSWPQKAGNLTQIDSNGTTIFSGDFPGPSAIISGWQGTADDRTAAPGASLTLTFTFAKNIGHKIDNFSLHLDFGTAGSVDF